MKATYRADIDGLRALAVIPVVLYHLNVRPISGGYIGVDVFFVISGYLITQLILSDIRDGSFSIVRFYERRARRIFPALFVMCGVTAIGVLALRLPNEVAGFKDSLIAAALFVSNIYFYFTQDYYGPAADTLPLLHTWSLAVEEQFYIFFPLLMLVGHRYFPGARTRMLAVLFALSLATSIWLVSSNPPAAFYLIQARTWELMVGSLLAIGAIPVVSRRITAEVLAATGVLLIVLSVLIYNDSTPFPGLAALAPCIGTALVIHSGASLRTVTARALSFGPVRFVGLISYSLYLWHWPIAVATLSYWNPLTKPAKLVALSLSIALAILSWRFVERPFRRQPYVLPGKKILAASATAIVALVVLALGADRLSPNLWDIPDAARQLLAMSNRPTSHEKSCFLSSARNDLELYDRENCLRLSDDRPNWLVVGDSMSNDIMNGLKQSFPAVNVLQASSSGCRPVVGGAGERRCIDLRKSILEEFVPSHPIDAIIFSARWRAEEADDLAATVALIKPYVKTVIVFGPRVLYRQPLPRLLAMQIIKKDPTIADRARDTDQKDVDRLFADKLAGTGAQYFSVYQAICPENDRCRTTDDLGNPLQIDYGHFTAPGALYVLDQLKRTIDLVAAPTQGG